MCKYSVGIDYGSLSGRAVLVNLETGEEVATSVLEYPHAVMDESLPCGKKLGVDWALQHPQDYLDVLKVTIPNVLKQANVSADDVVGVGIDFTACTVLPTKADGTPLCFIDEYKSEPHAYVKLWKHHAAQKYADMLNEIDFNRGEEFLNLYGGKILSEWLVPKVWQIADEAPHIYDEMDRFIEATDWVVWQLTGNETRNSCTAGYKALWHKQNGYPTNDFFKALHPKLENLVDEKLSRDILPLGTKAGEINEYASNLTGLKVGTPVAVGNVDAHVAVPAVGISGAGKMLMIMGTSTCHMLIGNEEKIVPGMCGVVEDGIINGFNGYEVGQSCVGDHFDWFVKNCVPKNYTDEAECKGINLHQLLREKAKKLMVGESGLVALDWWNGNRSVLVNGDLTGVMVGMTLLTKPEEIYRALIEATAYGTRMIIETFDKYGVPIDELFACGGITQKDDLMMQIYADVTNRTIKISASNQTPALGSAMYGAVVGGYFKDLTAAAVVMANLDEKVYVPIMQNVAVYNKLYAEYELLHNYFGHGENNVLKRLKELKKGVRG